jgi:farnesyl diphosphate synthase
MIIDDLPTVYEMPEEAVQWIDRMIDYTVAGGKMNRGLAMMSAYSTLMTEKGRKLSTKVSS